MQIHPMRRKKRELSEAETLAIMNNGEYCVLATVGADGQPYGVPLSYVYVDGKIFFHCTHKGHKLDNLLSNQRCSLTVIGKTQVIYDKDFTTYFESAIAFGSAHEITQEDEKRSALMALIMKYLPEHKDKADADIARSIKATAIYCIDVDHMTGKAKRAGGAG